MKTIDHAGMEWEVRDNPPYVGDCDIRPAKAFCADGDGFVVVYDFGSCFVVEEQFEEVSKHDTLESALDCAASILKNDYPAIYETYYFGEE